jgi:hypothetical protein
METEQNLERSELQYRYIHTYLVQSCMYMVLVPLYATVRKEE